MLGTILATVFSKAAAKAIGGGLAGAVLNGSGPMIDLFSKGLVAGAGPQIEQLGYVLGNVVLGYIVGFAVTWISPKNSEMVKR